MTLKSARPSLEVFYLKSTSTFFATDSSELPTAAEVAHDIVEEGVWAPMPFYLLGEMVTLAGMALLSSRFSRRKPDRKLLSTPISFLTSKTTPTMSPPSGSSLRRPQRSPTLYGIR